MTEIWKEYRQEQQDRRHLRLPIRTKQILSLRNLGYKIAKKTPYQFRINDVIDVYPIHNRYHNIKTGKRGGYRDIIEFIKKGLENGL